MRVLGLKMTNVMRVKAIEITPARGVTKISGENKQGKTTLMRGAAMVLEGKKSRPKETLRKGATKGSIQLDLGESEVEIKAELKLRKGKPDQVVITSMDGKDLGPPQTLFNKLRAGHTLDVRRFGDGGAAKRIETVEGLTGLDFAKHDAQRDGVFEKRKDANKEVKRLTGALESTEHHEGVPDSVVTVAQLSGELQIGMEKNAANAVKRAKLEDAREDAARVIADTKSKEGEREEATRQHEALMARIQDDLSGLAADLAEKQVAGKELVAEVDELEDASLDELRTQISTAEETNTKVRANAEHAKLSGDLDVARDKADRLTARLDAMDEVKTNAIADADYPVDGLTVGDDDVMFNGFNFSEASGAEKLVVGAAIDLALHPGFRVVYIDEASNLDDEMQGALETWAEANDVDVWMAVAGEEPGSVIIEDGMVKPDAPAETGGD